MLHNNMAECAAFKIFYFLSPLVFKNKTTTLMSSFTSQVTRSSGILSSEIPMVLFTSLKKFSFRKLRDWSKMEDSDWPGMLDAIRNWTGQVLAAEKDEFDN